MKNVAIRVVKSSRLPEKMAAYLVSIDRLLCLAFVYSWRFFIKKISLGWLLTLTTQPSTSKLSDNPGPLRGWVVRVLDLQFGGPKFKSRVAASWICTQYSPDFKSSTTLLKGRLVCLWPVGILNPSLCLIWIICFRNLLGPTAEGK